MWHTLYVVVCGISWGVVGVGCVRGWVRGLRQGCCSCTGCCWGCSYLLGSHYHGSMLFAFSVAPTVSDPDGSVHRAVADAVAIVRASGLPHQTGPMFTTIEGEWDECMDVIRRATEAVGKHGPRVSLVIKADIRPGHDHGEIEGKVQRLNAAIEQLDSGK